MYKYNTDEIKKLDLEKEQRLARINIILNILNHQSTWFYRLMKLYDSISVINTYIIIISADTYSI